MATKNVTKKAKIFPKFGNFSMEKSVSFEYDGDIRTVDTLVKQLRKKMTDEHPYIQSVYGVGYRFEVNENEE